MAEIDLHKPTKKANIWSKLSSFKKKITIIVTIITALVAIGKFSYEAFSRVSDIQSTIQDLVDLKHEHAKIVKFAHDQKLRTDSLKAYEIKEHFSLKTAITISKVILKDTYIGNIRFKMAPDKSVYFVEEGNIYPAYLDKESGNYFYDTGDKTYWCN